MSSQTGPGPQPDPEPETDDLGLTDDDWMDLQVAYNYGLIDPEPGTVTAEAFRRMDEYTRAETDRIYEEDLAGEEWRALTQAYARYAAWARAHPEAAERQDRAATWAQPPGHPAGTRPLAWLNEGWVAAGTENSRREYEAGSTPRSTNEAKAYQYFKEWDNNKTKTAAAQAQDIPPGRLPPDQAAPRPQHNLTTRAPEPEPEPEAEP